MKAAGSADDAGIAVRATNLDREVEVNFPGEVCEVGSAALPGEVLAALVRRLPNGGQCMVSAADGGRAKIASGSSNYDLRTLTSAELPRLRKLAGPEDEEEGVVRFSLPAEMLREMLKEVSYAVNPADDRPFCHGVLRDPVACG
jgi:DNA polymerase III subunit beta